MNAIKFLWTLRSCRHRFLRAAWLSLFFIVGITYIVGQTGTWKPLGPVQVPVDDNTMGANGLGQLSSIAFQPGYGTTNRTLYITASGGGLWRSNDDGLHWKVMNTDALPTLRSAFVAIHPNRPETVYLVSGSKEGLNRDAFLAGAGEVLFGQSYGIFKTTNANDTDANGNSTCRWSEPIGKWYDGADENANEQTGFWKFPSRKMIPKIMLHPYNPDIMYALVNFAHQGNTVYNGADVPIPDSGYVYKSTDAGEHWFKVFAIADELLHDIELKPGDPNTIFISGQRNIWSSYDAGVTWNNCTRTIHEKTQFPGFRFQSRCEIAVSNENPSLLYACILFIESGNVEIKIFLSKDDGRSFQQQHENAVFADGTGGRAGFDVSPLNAKLVAIGLNQFSFSDDAGKTIQINAAGGYNASGYNFADRHYMHADIQRMVFSPAESNVIFVCTDGGLFRCEYHPNQKDKFSCTNLSNGLNVRRSIGFASSQQNKNLLYEGGWDVGTLQSDFSKTNPFTTIYGGDGGYCSVDPVNDRQFIVNHPGGYCPNNYSTDGGKNFRYLHPKGITFTHPLYAHTFFTSTADGTFYRMQFDTSHDLIVKQQCSSLLFNALSVCKSKPTVMYAVHYNAGDWSFPYELYISKDGGFSFAPVTAPDMHNRRGYLTTSVTVNPYNASQAWVCFWSAETKVMTTQDMGETWTDYSVGLPEGALCRDILFLEGTNGLLLLGTDAGVFYRNTASVFGTWKKLGSGLPNAVITKLEYLPKFDMVRVSTAGRGLWEISLQGMSFGKFKTITYPVSQTWEIPVRLKASLTVPKKVSLQLSGDLYADKNVKIKTKGKLDLNGYRIIRPKD